MYIYLQYSSQIKRTLVAAEHQLLLILFTEIMITGISQIF